MADQFVQLNPDSTGKKVDVSELTVGSNTVERQRITGADPVYAANLQTVAQDGAATVRQPEATTLLGAILIELRLISMLLNESQFAASQQWNLDDIRTDLAAADSPALFPSQAH